VSDANAGGVRVFGGDAGERSWFQAMARGLSKKCPACGVGRLFDGYSRVKERCAHCGLDFTGHRADDAPPYVTILIVGHISIPLALAVKTLFDPPLGLQFLFWTPVVFLSALGLLPIAKGGLIGLQWANRMHGFGGAGEDDDV
jgi:uncharacterized protein (DUF983 family)